MVLIAAAVAILLFWPRMVWPRAPLGPVAAAALLGGAETTLTPVSAAFHGSIRVRADIHAGWMFVSYNRVTQLPPHDVYEAWYIEGTRHVKAGTFSVNAERHESVWVHTPVIVHEAVAVGVTVEPKPGTSKPTGARAFFGKLP